MRRDICTGGSLRVDAESRTPSAAVQGITRAIVPDLIHHHRRKSRMQNKGGRDYTPVIYRLFITPNEKGE